MKYIEPVSPGEILQEEFLIPMQISAYRLAKEIHIPQSRISDIIRGHRGITADTAMRLSRFFGTTPEFWLNIQNRYELDKLQDEKKIIQFSDIHPISQMQG